LGRHYLSVCQKSFVSFCKGKNFRSSKIPAGSTAGISKVWYRYIRRRFSVFFNDLRTSRGFKVLWVTGCKFSGDEGLSVFKTV
jgi:hypothetical protein